MSLLPGLLLIKRTNVAHGVPVSPLFEISRVFLPQPTASKAEANCAEVLPHERTVLAVLSDATLLELKGVLEQLLDVAGLREQAVFEPLDESFFSAGQAARIRLGDEVFGVMGEVSEAVADRFDLPNSPRVAEVDFDLFVRKANLERTYAHIPAFPEANRDIAVLVDDAVPWATLRDTLAGLEIPILERIRFFDLFRGKQVPKGKKSVAFSLTFRAPDRTLRSEEVEEARQSCIKALVGLGAELRQ